MARTMHDAGRLTDQQLAFVESYFRCGFDPVEAAKQAGYSHKRAHITGYQLLGRPHIRRAIRRESEHYAERVAMGREELLGHVEEIIRNRRDNSAGDRIKAVQTLATLTGMDRPTAGDARRRSLEELRDLDRERLVESINQGQSAAALPSAEIIDAEARRAGEE